jgi:biotin transport system substrate-specific component
MAGIPSNVLVDNFSEKHTIRMDNVSVLGFSVLTGLSAQVKIPLPFTPVPLTLQTFAVLLSGAILGWRRGFLAQALYLAEGAVGLPVFAGGTANPAHLLGLTGGYLWSYPFAAALVGWMVERGASRSAWRLALTMILSDLLILVSGTLWLQFMFRIPTSQTWHWGFYPFLVGDILKVALVGGALPEIMKRYPRSVR